jgi:hypothetical protein
MWLFPLGLAVLITGFMNSSVMIEMAGGVVLVLSALLYASNLFTTWLRSNHQGSAASDHLLVATFFLVLTLVLGVLVAANNLTAAPVMPFGSLHLAGCAPCAEPEETRPLPPALNKRHQSLENSTSGKPEHGHDGIGSARIAHLECASFIALHPKRHVGVVWAVAHRPNGVLCQIGDATLD